MAKSIYDIICENVGLDGRLPKGFRLPATIQTPDGENYVPGARDSLEAYPNVELCEDSISTAIYSFLQDHKWENMLLKVRQYGAKQVHDRFRYMFGFMHSSFNIPFYQQYSHSLLNETNNIEYVKFAITMIGLYKGNMSANMLKQLETLALFDEFTYYVITILICIDEGYNIILRIAQKVDGWGKIAITKLLATPYLQERKDWVLRYGCENSISEALLGRYCARNGDLPTALSQETLDPDLYNGIAIIINAMLSDVNEKGMSKYSKANDAIPLYLKHAQMHATTMRHFWFLMNLKASIDTYKLTNKSKKEVTVQCSEICSSQTCTDLILSTLSNPDSPDFQYACDMALALCMDITEQIKANARSFPVKDTWTPPTFEHWTPTEDGNWTPPPPREKIKKEETTPKTKSIYEIISESVGSDGRLPDDFTLPNWKVDPSGIRFRAGDFDGGLYFYPQADDPKRVARQLVDAVQSKNEVEIVSIVGKYGVIQYWDYFMREYTQRANELDAKFIYNYATFLAFELADIELIKLGISLLCVFMLTDVHHARTQLETLALFDEFTFFVVENLEDWENGNDSIFKIAQKVNGWGKIRAVKSLKPETQEIKDWLLRYGCKNDVSNSMLALECATKGDLIGVLQSGKVDAELYDSIAILFDALLGEHHNMGIRVYNSDEGPEEMPTELADVLFDEDGELRNRPKGLEDYQYAEEAVTLYLQLAEKYAVSVKHLWYLSNLVTALESTNIHTKDELIKQCCKICDTQATRDLILAALSDPKSREFFRAMQLAEGLAMDITDYLYTAVKADPIKNSVYLPRLFHIPEYAQELTALYESVLPLEQMKTGMGDLLFAETLNSEHHTLEILLGQLAAYPNMGSSLVKAALYSPITRERNFACRVLTAWCDKLGKPLSDVSLGLYTALADTVLKEVNPKTKATMCKILGLEAPKQ